MPILRFSTVLLTLSILARGTSFQANASEDNGGCDQTPLSGIGAESSVSLDNLTVGPGACAILFVGDKGRPQELTNKRYCEAMLNPKIDPNPTWHELKNAKTQIIYGLLHVQPGNSGVNPQAFDAYQTAYRDLGVCFLQLRDVSERSRVINGRFAIERSHHGKRLLGKGTGFFGAEMYEYDHEDFFELQETSPVSRFGCTAKMWDYNSIVREHACRITEQKAKILLNTN
ncbi:MAG: hypothetical protein AB7P04_14190 [Bacteriovoracia bacterium]